MGHANKYCWCLILLRHIVLFALFPVSESCERCLYAEQAQLDGHNLWCITVNYWNLHQFKTNPTEHTNHKESLLQFHNIYDTPHYPSLLGTRAACAFRAVAPQVLCHQLWYNCVVGREFKQHKQNMYLGYINVVESVKALNQFAVIKMQGKQMLYLCVT